jgi:spermidine synthase
MRVKGVRQLESSKSDAMQLETIDPATGATIVLTGTLVAQLQTSKSEVALLNTEEHGDVLIMNKEVQSSAADERLYHETLVGRAIRGGEGRVVIFGGGEGCTAREVLAAAADAAVIQYDYDAEFVEWCRTGPLRAWNCGAYDNSRLQVHFDDAFRAVRFMPDADAIIVDMFDWTEETADKCLQFICDACQHLRPGGRLTAYLGDDDGLTQQAVCKLQNLLFADFAVQIYKEHIPSYGAAASAFLLIESLHA